MGLLDRIKSALGLSTTDESTADRGTDVAVEYEPDAESESAVKGVDVEASAASEGDAAASTGSLTEEPPEEGVDAATEPAEAAGPQSQVEDPDAGAETEPGADEDETGSAADGDEEEGAAEDDESETAADTDESGVEGDDDAEAVGDTDESETADETSADDDADADDDAADDRPVDSLTGIGSAYAERLADAGVETVGDLVEADPLTVAEESGISEKRIERWMETARETR
ncbi:MAG: helix-hairpin-helix domain-containing protein [Haloarculaceae archaeon]